LVKVNVEMLEALGVLELVRENVGVPEMVKEGLERHVKMS
jgi:hypothetical protein